MAWLTDDSIGSGHRWLQRGKQEAKLSETEGESSVKVPWVEKPESSGPRVTYDSPIGDNEIEMEQDELDNDDDARPYYGGGQLTRDQEELLMGVVLKTVATPIDQSGELYNRLCQAFNVRVMQQLEDMEETESAGHDLTVEFEVKFSDGDDEQEDVAEPSHSRWEAACVYSPAASDSGSSGSSPHYGPHSAHSRLFSTEGISLGPPSPHSPASPRERSPRSPRGLPDEPLVHSPVTPDEGEASHCVGKVMHCCDSPYIRGNRKVRDFLLSLPQGPVCDFFAKLRGRLATTVPQIVGRPVLQAVPTKWTAGRVLGRGAFGECALAMDHETGRLMAVKRIKLTGGAREVAESVRALRQEVEVLRSVQHPHVVSAIGVSLDAGDAVLEAGDGGMPLGGVQPERRPPVVSIWMDFMEGGSLASVLADFGALPEQTVALYVRQIVLGLEHLHACGIVHGDIKPANVLLDKHGVVRISDFGCAQFMASGQAPSHTDGALELQPYRAPAAPVSADPVVAFDALILSAGLGAARGGRLALGDAPEAQKLQGTPQYMAPELIRGARASAQSDMWALGLTVLEALSGKAGWDDMSNKQALLFKIGRGAAPAIPAHLSEQARDFVAACTRQAPEDRPAASELYFFDLLRAAGKGAAAGTELSSAMVRMVDGLNRLAGAKSNQKAPAPVGCRRLKGITSASAEQLEAGNWTR